MNILISLLQFLRVIFLAVGTSSLKILVSCATLPDSVELIEIVDNSIIIDDIIITQVGLMKCLTENVLKSFLYRMTH